MARVCRRERGSNGASLFTVKILRAGPRSETDATPIFTRRLGCNLSAGVTGLQWLWLSLVASDMAAAAAAKVAVVEGNPMLVDVQWWHRLVPAKPPIKVGRRGVDRLAGGSPRSRRPLAVCGQRADLCAGRELFHPCYPEPEAWLRCSGDR